MADYANANANSREVELEAKRRVDCSWHPCQVSLCSGGGLAVNFEGQDSEYVILNVEDAFACLRVRSSPLCGDDCCYIKEGNRVLVAYEQNSQRLFFDAVVEKAERVRHSMRAGCRCTFMIKWLFQDVRKLTVPSGSIMKLATESIKSHPIVAAFLDSVENSPLSTPLPSPSVFDETEGEIDLHGLLGKQIEDIGSFADFPRKELLKGSLMGVDHGASSARIEGWPNLLAPEQVSKLHVDVSCRQTHSRRSGRKQNKIETTTEDLLTSAPSSFDKSGENRSPLSPLAARAVLASLRSKVPQKIEFVHDEEGKHVSLLDDTAHNHSSMTVVNGMMMSRGLNSHSVNDIESKPANLVDNVESHVKIKTRSSGKKLSAQKSLGALVIRDSDKNETMTGSGGSPSPPSSIREESIQPVRLTRSAAKGNSGTPNGEVESRMQAEDVTVARVTRSGAYKRNGYLVDNVRETLQGKRVRTTEAAFTATKRETLTSNIEDKSKSIDEKEKEKVTFLTSNARTTRSAARKDTGILDGKVEEALQDKLGTETAQSNNCQESDPVSDSDVSTKQRTLPLVSAELKLAVSNKKQEGSNDDEKRQKIAVEGLHTHAESRSQKKSIPSKKQPLRFSPRLRFLPQTRSQTTS